MKSSIRTMFVMLAIVMSFVLAQDVWTAHFWQCEKEVEGAICEITKRTEEEPSSIVLLVGEGDCETIGSTVTVYGIPFDKLEKKWPNFLNLYDTVKILAHECPFPTNNQDGQLKACGIYVDDYFIFFNHGGNLKPKYEAGFGQGERRGDLR